MLDSLDPASQQDLAALTGIAGLLQRYSGDPVVENALIEEVGGTSLLGAFTSLVPVGPEPDATPEEVHDWWLSLSPAQQLAASLVQSRFYGNLDGIPAHVRDLASRKNLPEYREELLGMLENPDAYQPGEEPSTIDMFLASGDSQISAKLRRPRPSSRTDARATATASCWCSTRSPGSRCTCRGRRRQRRHRGPRRRLHPRAHQHRPGQPEALRQPTWTISVPRRPATGSALRRRRHRRRRWPWLGYDAPQMKRDHRLASRR